MGEEQPFFRRGRRCKIGIRSDELLFFEIMQQFIFFIRLVISIGFGQPSVLSADSRQLFSFPEHKLKAVLLLILILRGWFDYP